MTKTGKSKNDGRGIVYKNAKTGRFVTKETKEKHPETHYARRKNKK